MSRRERLGRGLGALLSEYSGAQELVSETSGAAARSIPVSAIVPNPFQPRRDFSDEELTDLATSMRENGLLQPVVVRPVPGVGQRYELVAGERRWRASVRLGWSEIPATVRELDDRAMLVLAIVENVQRSELSPLEEAEAFQRLSDDFQLTQQDIADVVGRDRSTVANALRLLQLPASVRQLVAERQLSAGHARALLGLGGERQMADLAREAAEQGWSVREVESRVQRARGGRERPARAEKPRDLAERELEEELQRVFGAEVRIRHGRGDRGRIEIPYLDADDFERVFEMLAGRPAGDVVS
jgi:ParB family transcriptional regulator, chromosome partitioning protein